MPSNPADVVRYIKLIRYGFQRLRTLGDDLHADLGLNTSHRAVLEWLSEHGRKTVPQIAAAKSVSRQHIQKIVDELIGKGHADLEANPAHKRSPFVVLTQSGASLFAEMQRREAPFIERLAASTDQGSLMQSLSELQRFTDSLSRLIGEKDESAAE